MKQLYKTLVLFYVFSSYAFAQDTTKTKLRKWGVGLRVNTQDNSQIITTASLSTNPQFGISRDNSYSAGLQLQYQYKENCAVRFITAINKFNASYIDTTIYTPSHSINQYTDQNTTQTTYLFAPGILWRFNNYKLSVYGGIEVQVKFYGNIVGRYTAKSFENDTLSEISVSKGISDGGKSAGLGGFIGFNYYLLKNASIGFEVSSAYTYYKVDGKYIAEYYTTDALGNITDRNTQVKILKTEYFKFVYPVASLNILFWF